MASAHGWADEEEGDGDMLSVSALSAEMIAEIEELEAAIERSSSAANALAALALSDVVDHPEDASSAFSVDDYEDEPVFQLTSSPARYFSASARRRSSPIVPEAPAEVGYDCERFLEEHINEDFLCPICRNVVQDAVECPQCESLFCHAHLLQWLMRSGPSCPQCKQRLEPEAVKRPSRIIRNTIDKLRIRCPHDTRGCSEGVALADLSTHVSKVCLYAPEFCKWPGCPLRDRKSEGVNRGVLGEHTEQCTYRLVQCPLQCGKQIPFCKIQQHQSGECENYSVECTLGCGKSFTRGHHEQHLMTCDRALVPCSFRGCTANIRRCDVARHLETAMVEHMQLLNAVVVKQASVLEAQAREIADLKKYRHCSVLQSPDSATFPVTGMAEKLTQAQISKTKYRTPRVMLANGLHFEVEVAFDHQHVSVYLSLQPGAYDGLLPWPFDSSYTLCILDQSQHEQQHIERAVVPPRHPDSQAFRRRDVESLRGHGFAKFASIKRLHGRNYILNDTMYVKVIFHPSV